MTWRSSKQEIVADLTIESECIVASEAKKEAMWLKFFINDLGVMKKWPRCFIFTYVINVT